MTVQSISQRQMSRVLTWLLFPLTLIERTRGRKRLALLFAYTILAVVLGVFGWRALSLRGLPDVGEPFDVAAFARETVPESEDAFTIYREALSSVAPRVGDTDYASAWNSVRAGWSRASDDLKTRLDRHRPALLIWQRGTERSRAMPVPRDQWTPINPLHQTYQQMVDFGWMALLEGTRLEEAGDTTGAWAWYSAVLRASRHLQMRSSSTLCGSGRALASLAGERVVPWAQNPRTDGAALRRALTDLLAVQKMTPPNSEALKADYLTLMSIFRERARATSVDDDRFLWFNDHPRLYRLLTYLRREPERSQRVENIVFAHWLRHADNPPSARPALVGTQSVGNESFPDFPYTVPPGSRPVDYPISAHDLYLWHRSTIYASRFTFLFMYYLPALDSQRRSHDTLLITVAEQLYQREHGELPASAQELVRAGYLKELPSGYKAGQAASMPVR
jgi:hypothetical protein